jgi:hypothetical protein
MLLSEAQILVVIQTPWQTILNTAYYRLRKQNFRQIAISLLLITKTYFNKIINT